jgi:hypothetical protein
MEHALTLEQVLTKGEELYLNRFRKDLEREYFGQIAVIHVESGEYVTGENKVIALDKAKEKFGEHIFYIVEVGNLDVPTKNFRGHALPAWGF